MMRQAPLILFLACLLLPLAMSDAVAQLEANLGALTEENAEEYLQVLPETFSGALNTAIFRTGYIPKEGLSIRVGIEAVAVAFNDDDRTYSPAYPVGFVPTDPNASVKVPTVIGDVASISIPGQAGTELYYPGGFDIENMSIATPQLTIGNFMGTQAVIRFIAIDLGDIDLGDLQLLGLGVQHSISQYFQDWPFDLAAGVFYQNFQVGEDLIKSNALHLNVTGSRRFGVLEPYVGLGLDSYSMDVEYESDVEDPGSDIDLSFDGENSLHFTLGTNLDLSILHLHVEINQAQSTALAAGLSIGR